MKLHSLRIKDELQSQRFSSPQYLACSVVKTDNLSDTSNSNEASVALHEDDDIFTDALPDFMLLSEPGAHPQSMDIAQHGRLEEVGDYADIQSEVAHEKVVGQGQGVPSEEFYEAQGSDFSDFVSITFSAKSSASPHYDGIDTQVCAIHEGHVERVSVVKKITLFRI